MCSTYDDQTGSGIIETDLPWTSLVDFLSLLKVPGPGCQLSCKANSATRHFERRSVDPDYYGERTSEKSEVRASWFT